MAITAQSADGKIHEFPDGTDGAVVDRVMKQYASGQSAAAPSQPQQDRGVALDAIDYVSGIMDWPNRLMGSAAELVARGTDAAGISDGAYKMFRDMRASSPSSKYSTAGAIIGDIGATLPLNSIRVAGALPKLANAGGFMKGAARITDAALQGGAATLATSSSNDAPLGDQLTLGAGISAAVPTVGMLARGGKNLVRGVIGETTGAGGQSIAEAYKAGLSGGDASQAFTGAMRGGSDNWGNVVTDAKAALGNLRTQRGKDYRAGMIDISNDATVLDFKPIDDALASSVKVFKGQNISTKTGEVREEIGDAVAKWRALDPAEYHTPEGMDALKQQIGEIKDSLPYGSPSRSYADGVYNSIRGTIAKQAPVYDKTMKAYSDASDEIAAIEKELSLGKKVNPNTALRKLQSVMRDNANTSWGRRASMADRLAEAGAPNLMPSLAGQALSAPIPRGLAKYADAGLIGLATISGNPMSLAALPFASPRLMGEAAHGAGLLNRNVRNAVSFLPPVPLPRISAPAVGLLSQRVFGQ